MSPRTLDSPASPYAGPPETLPVDPPADVPCPTCEDEYTPTPGESECGDCGAVRALLHALDEDGQVRLVRELEDELDWTARRLKGVTANG